jgi:hypothetical protein
MYFILGSINIWPSKEKILHYMPTDFQKLYPNVGVIIDCTEIFTERPSLALVKTQFVCCLVYVMM